MRRRLGWRFGAGSARRGVWAATVGGLGRSIYSEARASCRGWFVGTVMAVQEENGRLSTRTQPARTELESFHSRLGSARIKPASNLLA
jgi:hypothetical protein